MNLRAVLILCLIGLAHPLPAQVADEGTLVIRVGSREIGSETFRVTSGAAGLRIFAKASYPGSRPPTELSVTVERSGPAGELTFQLERRGGSGGGQVYAIQKRNRLTIRRVERGGEQASETPGAEPLVLLADSVFSLYLQILPLTTEVGRAITAVVPQGARRMAFTAQRLPSATNGSTLIRLSGGVEGEIALGNRGELLRISLPVLGLEALRKRD
ncbi:MAG TPA: hypothetical protein VH879_09620 [Gemmatimonadales bacterium]|jgi:hypothetical protein